MNLHNILLLADRLERNDCPTIEGKPMTFDSAGCIAGWAMALASPTEFGWLRAMGIGKAFLDLDYEQASSLFEPDLLLFGFDEEATYEDITREQAARVLRHLATTGTVDWSIADA